MAVKKISRSVSFSPQGYEVIQYLQHECNVNVSRLLEKLLLRYFEYDLRQHTSIMKGEQ